jgi:hypothetical protein
MSLFPEIESKYLNKAVYRIQTTVRRKINGVWYLIPVVYDVQYMSNIEENFAIFFKECRQSSTDVYFENNTSKLTKDKNQNDAI